MGYLSRNDLERIATRIFNDYKHLPGLMSQQVDYVDPEILACGLFGFHIDYFHLSKDGLTLRMTAFKEVAVEIYNDSKQPCLYYLDVKTLLIETDLKNNPTLYGRYHFTMAHETAHQILAGLYPTDRVTQNRVIHYRGHSPQHPIRDWSEWQADNLASALLLPIEIVYGALHRFDLEHGIDILSKVYRPKEYGQFCEMAEFLGVSKQAMSIRLKRLSLLKKDYLQNPYVLVDVEKEDDEGWLNL
ncbi:ImmA/IrrE family metallo-endopeptidase [Flintibacter muris]|uniref:ImmA/IrrE family metallo-endopeptidase n=1 Tax=Flintibacter muris TaxID=2941327 RepID=UPI00203EC942|nr:ImmA/IrrE family metallo-endopeptidase [Flintibacter muris]